MRIHIIGASGSGKTTLGHELASRLHIHHYELDKAEEIQTEADVLALAEQPDWITEGIYLIWTEPLLYHADCIVLLEISWPVAAWRILRRHIWNSLRGTQLYPGINGIKSLIKLLKDNRRYILNLDGRDPPLAEKFARCIETHQAMNEPLTEDSLKAYYEAYKELALLPAEDFVRLYLEKYQEKLYLIRNAAERERFLTSPIWKGSNQMSSSTRTAYTEARTRLLAEITEYLRNDERFVAAWLAGSFGRGEQTWLSDLDLHVVVDDAHSKSLCATPWPAGAKTTPERLTLFSQFGTPTIVFDAHGNNTMGGTFTYVAYQEAGQNVDWMLIPQAKAYREAQSLVLFDKVGLPDAPTPEPESLKECMERASDQIGFFWMIAASNAANLLKGHAAQVHMLLMWLEDSIREVQAALKGEHAQFTKNSHVKIYVTQEEQAVAMRRLCDEMEELMPAVVEKGGYVPADPRAIVEKRLALLKG